MGDIIFSGATWGMPPTGDASTRGKVWGVGGARLHEVGSAFGGQTPVGKALHDSEPPPSSRRTRSGSLGRAKKPMNVTTPEVSFSGVSGDACGTVWR